MSLYNLINGYSPCVLFVLPMLDKHPDEYPRFRDCFLQDPDRPDLDNYIHIYTRTGGGNREAYKAENEALRQMPGFVTDFDDAKDSTYASWVFEVPEQWKKDFDVYRCDLGKPNQLSPAYREQMKKVYPKLAGVLDAWFASADKDASESAEAANTST